MAFKSIKGTFDILPEAYTSGGTSFASSSAWHHVEQVIRDVLIRFGFQEIRTPIIELSKAEIVRKGIELGAPLHLTWSCYRSEDLACGTCDSCALRLRGFERAGLEDPIPYRR